MTLKFVAQAEAAAADINIDEASTRTLIDAQLAARGWDADTPTMRYSAGTRPAKGRNMAIAEWPTKSGPADYALFIGTRCIGVVEAKRRNKNVSSHIDQAQRYARGFRFEGGARSYRRSVAGLRRGTLSCSLRLFGEWASVSETDRNRRAGSGSAMSAKPPIIVARLLTGQRRTA